MLPAHITLSQLQFLFLRFPGDGLILAQLSEDFEPRTKVWPLSIKCSLYVASVYMGVSFF